MSEGWIVLQRSICDHWIWQDEPFDKARAWIDLLFLANWEDVKTSYKGQIITCKRGDVNFSVNYLADRWSWSRHKTSDFLNLLESDGMIKQIRTKHRTTISIVNYEIYQDIKGNKKDNKRTTKGQQADIIKEIKEIKEIKDIYGAYSHISLTREEFEKLGSEYGSEIRDQAITFLDEYIEEKPKYKHSSDYLCIRRWVIDAVKERQAKSYKPAKKNSFNDLIHNDYDFNEIEKSILT